MTEPTTDAKLLADEIESVGKGLAIEGRSIQGGRILLPEEDALIVAALRAYGESSPQYVQGEAKEPLSAWPFHLLQQPAQERPLAPSEELLTLRRFHGDWKLGADYRTLLRLSADVVKAQIPTEASPTISNGD